MNRSILRFRGILPRSFTNHRRALGVKMLVGMIGALVFSLPTLSGVAGADTQIYNGTKTLNTGWIQEKFFTCYTSSSSSQLDGCPFYDDVLNIDSVAVQGWSSTTGNYDKMVQDFWNGFLGLEPGSGAPYTGDPVGIQITGEGAAHYDAGASISTSYSNGTCGSPPSLPAFEPCEESNFNQNGHHYLDAQDYSYILYSSSHGYYPENYNGAQSETVLNGNVYS